MEANGPEIKREGLDENLQDVYDLKVAALELLLGSHDISREVQMQIKDIFDKVHLERSLLVQQLADYLSKKNPKIFEVDTLMKQGHGINDSMSINQLQLSGEDKSLLEWFQQVRI